MKLQEKCKSTLESAAKLPIEVCSNRSRLCLITHSARDYACLLMLHFICKSFIEGDRGSPGEDSRYHAIAEG